MLTVANPIYDSIFKFLVEDKRVARVLLSALLKKEVVDIDMRPHEYANTVRDKISMFRIDFGAKVREDDGSERLVLIELQKTWLETETLRFRQYLGAQYSNKDNMRTDGKYQSVGLPMVAIYLLGHRVGDIQEPVFYVTHNAYDYDGNIVPGGIDDPFVESLTHNSIIVQIPLLHRKITNRLGKVLSFFDQTARDKDNPQLINIDVSLYEGDDDMMYIVRRLTEATVNHELRQEMNVEDEFITAIEDRDTALMTRDKKLKEKDQQLKEKNQQLEEKSQQLEEKSQQLDAKNQQLEEKSQQLDAKNQQLEEKSQQLDAKNQQLEAQGQQLEAQGQQLEAQGQKIDEQERMLKSAIQSLLASGMSEENVAMTLNITIDNLRKYGI